MTFLNFVFIMPLRKHILSLALFLTTVLQAIAAPRFLNYTSADGMSSNSVLSIIQDRDGYLWVGTRNGLNLFDGARFKVWKASDGLPDNMVTALAVDRGNNIWIGTPRGICVMRGGRVVNSYLSRAHANYVRALLCDSEGYVWAAYFDGFVEKYSFDGAVRCEGSDKYEIGEFVEGEYFYHQLFEDNEGRIWVGGRMVTGSFVLDRKGVKVHGVPGAVCIGSYASDGQGGVIAFNDYTYKLCRYNPLSDKFEDIGSMAMGNCRLLRDSRGRLWVAGSYGLGLVNESDPSATYINRHISNEPESLGSLEINCIFEDRQRNIWLGGDRGLSVLCPALNLVRGREMENVMALLQTRDGRIIAADGNKSESCLYEDRQGRIYTGLWNMTGFTVADGNKTRKYAVRGKIPSEYNACYDGDLIGSNWYSDFLEDSAGRFWCITWEGLGLNEFDRTKGEFLPPRFFSPNKRPTPENDSCKFLSSRLGSRIVEDIHGDLIYGTTTAGLNVIDTASWTVRKFISEEYVTDMANAPDGRVWIGTHSGLYVYSRDSAVAPVPKFAGVRINSLELDGRGRVWAGTDEGLMFIDENGKLGVAHKFAGFRSDIYGERVSCTLKDGGLAFGGATGYDCFNPDSLLSAGSAPEVLVSSLRTGGGRLEFAFSSSDMALGRYCSYRYMLEGEDEEWRDAHWPDLSSRYAGLKPGKYSLKIQCSDIFGRWSEPNLYEIRIYPPLLLRWYFLLLYIAVLTGSVVLIIRLRERKILREKKALEKAVEEKTASLQEEIRMRNRFFSIVSHDLRGPVLGIKMLTEEMEANFGALSKDDLGQSLNLLMAASGRTYDMLEELLMWAVSQEKMIKPELQEYNAKNLIDAAAASVSERAVKKSVTFRVEVPAHIFLLADRNLMLTVLRNLFDNAVKFSYEGGEVLVYASDGGICIRDNGTGIDPLLINYIFSPDRKTSKKGTSGEAGSGLGLVIVKELLEKMGYVISVRNCSGGGAEFIIEKK